MSSPLVSVIVPVYNAELYVAEAIRCILKQTYSNIELLVLNDGSDDSSLEILRSFEDSRIILIQSDENRGLVYQLNRGIDRARGKYIVRMDADDTCVPERFERQVNFMESNHDIGLCGSYVKVFGNVKWDWKMPVRDGSIRYSLLFGATFAHNAVIIRKEILDRFQIRYRKEAFPVEDYDMWLRLLEKTKAANIPDFLTTYRIYGNQVTSKYEKEKNRLLSKFARETFERYFFSIAPSDTLSYNIFMGRERLSKETRSNFEYFLRRIENSNSLEINKDSLRFNLDKSRLKHYISLGAKSLVVNYLLQRHFFSRMMLFGAALRSKLSSSLTIQDDGS